MSNCTRCGAPIAPNRRFCTECGRPMAARAVLTSTAVEPITFYLHHAAPGLVEIGSPSVPPVQ